MLTETREALRSTLGDQLDGLEFVARLRYGDDAVRFITVQQEAAYRLCHQDFFGLAVADAAEILGTSVSKVRLLLAGVKAVAPQLFPILSPKAAKVYSLFMDNFTSGEIAEEIGCSVRSVQSTLRKLRHKAEEIGLYFPVRVEQRTSFGPWMEEDNGIAEWF